MSEKLPLLLLHGAIGAADQFVPLHEALFATTDVHIVEFPGHGDTPALKEPFSIGGFAAALESWMDEKGIAKADIFGYSMGGYVALWLARYRPERVHRVMTLATKFAWDEATAAKETKMLDPNTISAKVPAFASTLQRRHAANGWENVLQKTAAMMQELGKSPALTNEHFPQIAQPVKICIGDRDKMVSLEETINVYRQLPLAQLSVWPATPHPIEQVSTARLAQEISEFFQS